MRGDGKGRLLSSRLVSEVRRRTWRGAGALAVAMGLMAMADSRSHAQGILDFVSFDGIDYLRWAEEPGRPLERGDLGVEFATVGCSIGMHAVRGHATEFRLAAVWRDRIFLYQAWRNPRAKVGGKLYDIAGKVRAIDVQRGEPTPAAPGTPLRIASARDVETLVDMIVHSPVRRPQAHAFGEPRYWLTFWLTDGTTLGRPYFVETSELMGGVVLPGEFARILERYLGE